MVKVKELFPGWYDYSTREFNDILKKGIISLDTNVILNLYRYSKEASEEALKCLDDIKDRLMISYYVVFEFTKNRKKTSADSLEDYNKYGEEISKKYNDIENILNTVPNNKMFNKEKLIAEVCKNREKIMSSIESEKNKKEELFNSGLETKICNLLDDRIIEKYNEDDFTKVKAEGIRRQKEQIPPGYKDAEKGDNGDYHIFSQLIDYAKENDKNVIFVTDDNKEDMFQKIHGIKIPRSELLQEFYEKTGHKLIILTFQEFLKNDIIFKAKISKELLEEIKLTSQMDKMINLRTSNRIVKLLNRTFKYNSIDDVKKNIDNISGCLRTAIKIMNGVGDNSLVDEYQYLLSLLEDNNFDEFIKASSAHQKKISRNKEYELFRLSHYYNEINVNSNYNFISLAFESLMHYVDCYSDDYYEEKKMLFQIRQARSALMHDEISITDAIKIFNSIYEIVTGGIFSASM